MNEISFRIGPIRPPSEADSLLIQITKGCTWNKCRFCQLYKGTSFQTYSADSIKHDIDNMTILAERVRRYKNGYQNWDIEGLNDELGRIHSPAERECFYMIANWLIHGGRHVFLQDGNSTVLRNGRLTDVLIYLKQAFPQINRITSYGRAENLSRLSAEEFAELKEAGLDRIHSGFETGSDEVLRLINKGLTQEQEITAGRNIKAGGIELSIYFMPGVGGRPLTDTNAIETARVVNAVNPDFLRIRTYTVKEGTDLYNDWIAGKFMACSDEEKLLEIRKVIELADGIDTRIVSDHIVNLLQGLEGSLVDDKAALLAKTDAFLTLPTDQKKRFQMLRRMGRISELSDMEHISPGLLRQAQTMINKIPEDEWEETMNRMMARYV